jgi:hypothetical protein
MECQRCESDRILSLCAKCSDLCSSCYKDREHDGYAPRMPNIGGGDYLEIDVCLQCGQLQGQFPIAESVMEEAFPIPQPDKLVVCEEDGVQYTGAFVTVPNRGPIPTKVTREVTGDFPSADTNATNS